MAAAGTPHNQASPDRLLGKVLAGRYEILSQLGKGGMAVVYEALDRSFERVVAVKVLRTDVAKDPIAAKRLVREARAAGQLHHPNIIMMHDVGECDGMVYIVMELMKGRELAELMDEEGAIEVRRALHIGRQVASALNVAHAHGIIHRDIKPENLFLLEHDREGDFVKMLDFSIAKLPTSMVTAALTRAGSVFGTPHYMAPEQVEGRAVSAQTDIYALGAVIYELIAGAPPFDGDSVIDILLQHAKRPPPRLSSLQGLVLPPGLSALIDSMLAKKESDRPASAEAVQVALERMIAAMDLSDGEAGEDDEDKPTMALPPIVAPSSSVAAGEDGPPPTMPPPSSPAPRIIRAPARPAAPPSTPAPPSPGGGSSRDPAVPRAGAGPSAPARRPPPPPPSPVAGPVRREDQEGLELSADLALPSALPSGPRPAPAGRRSSGKGMEANTLIGHGLADKVRAAAERADREAARASKKPAPQPPVAVPPPPSGRASLPSVYAPGALGGGGHRSVRPAPSPARRPSRPGRPSPPSEQDGVPTRPEMHIDDLRELERASQETLAVSPAQMRELSQQLRVPVGPRRGLVWVIVPVAVVGVIGLAVAAWYLMAG